MHGYLLLGTTLALGTVLPLAWKWQLGVFRAGLFVLAESMLMASALTAADPLLHFTTVTGTLAMWGGTVLAGLAGLLVVFFRDPDRLVPSREDVIVSPADGRVIYVRSVQPGQLPVADKKGRAYVLKELSGTMLGDGGAVAIGISMNLSDVHVNRAPIGGRVRLVQHVHGTFGSLRNPEMLLSNERTTTVIEAGDLQIALVQIASRLVRRIVTFVSKGDALQLGQRVGAIRFGSQVDMLIPAGKDIRLAVQVGDRVVAGRTIVAVIINRPGERDARPPGSTAEERGEPTPNGGLQVAAMPGDSGATWRAEGLVGGE
jgi:phosphatidylserine decarboxylase